MSFGSPLSLKTRINILDFGAIGGGQAGLTASGLPATQNDTAITNAVAAARANGGGFVVIPNDRFYTSTTFTLRLFARVHLVGDGFGPFDLSARGDGYSTDPLVSTQGPTIIISNSANGKPLFFNPDTAIIYYDGNQTISDIIFAFVQPTATVSTTAYVPVQYPWAIAGNTAAPTGLWLGGCEIIRCMLVGAWKGILFWGGRSRCIDTTIEAFSVGLKIDGTADVSYLSGLRFWPLHADILAQSTMLSVNSAQFQLANLTAMKFVRADEIMGNNLFVQVSAVGMQFADSGATPGPWGTFHDVYIETSTICVQVDRINGNGVQMYGGSLIPNYTADTTPNNTWLKVNPSSPAGNCYLLMEGFTVGAGAINTTNLTYIPIIDPTVIGSVTLRNNRNYNLGGIGSGPLAKITQAYTLPASIGLNTGQVVTCPQGVSVTYHIEGPPGPNSSLTVYMQTPIGGGYTQVGPPITNNTAYSIRLGPGQNFQVTTNLATTCFPVAEF